MPSAKVEESLSISGKDLPQEQIARLRALAEEIDRRDPADHDLVRTVFGLMGDKWNVLILLILATGSMRHSILRRLLNSMMPDATISQRILTLKLRAFEQNDMLERSANEDWPLKVEYTLNEMGHELAAHVRNLVDWINTHSERRRNQG